MAAHDAVGRAAEGRSFLEVKSAGRLEPADEAFVQTFTALARQRLGDPVGARAHLARAELRDPACPALPEVRRLVAASAWLPPTGRPVG